jgi:hypothetical protein
MPTSSQKFSKGYAGKKPPKKKAKAPVPKKPTVSEERAHRGVGKENIERERKQREVVEKELAPPPVSKQRQHRGVGKENKRRERKQLREADKVNIYQGRSKPKTKKDKVLASRGKAVRHILAGKSAADLKGETPLQSLKHTAALRESRIKEVDNEISKYEKKLTKPTKNLLESKPRKGLDPKKEKEYKANLSALRAEKNRLLGRKAKGNEFFIDKEKKKHTKEIRELGKKARTMPSGRAKKLLVQTIKVKKTERSILKVTGEREQAKAERQFHASQKKNRRAAKLAADAVYIPEVSGVVRNKKSQPPKPKVKASPFAIKGLVAPKAKGKKTRPVRFNVKEQPIPGDSWNGTIGGGTFTKAGIKELAEQSEQAASQPGTAEVLLTAATLAPIPLAAAPKALQLLGRGASALKGTRAGAAAVNAGRLLKDSKAVAGLEKALRSSPNVSKVVEKAVEAERKGRTVLTFTSKGVSAKWIPGKSVPNLARTIEANPVLKERIIHAAASKQNVALEKVARDSRIIAGAGAPSSVNASMAFEAVRKLQQFARPKMVGTELRLKRAAIKGGPVAAGLIGVSIADQDFRNAALRDTHDLIVGFVPSTYQFLTASGDALAWGFSGGFYGIDSKIGSPSRVEAMWEDALKTTPVALAFQGKWDEAYKAFQERPVSGVIELSGVYSVAGRGAGAFGRALPESISPRYGTRKPVEIVGDLRLYRDYSPNAFTKGLQVLGDGFSTRVMKDAKPKVVKGKVDYGSKLKNVVAKAEGEKYVLRMEKSADELFAIAQIGERNNRAQAEHGVGQAGKKAHKVHKAAPHAMWAIGTGIVRNKGTAISDLKAWKKDIETKHDSTSVTTIAAHQRETLDVIDTLLKNPKMFDDDRLWQSVDEFREQESLRQDELVASGALNPEARKYAPWIPYAVRYMGAKFDEKAGRFTINGKTLTLAEIQRHAKDVSGMDAEPVMISTQRVDAGDGGRQSVLALPNADTWKATGQHIENGTADVAFSSLARQAVLSRSIIDKRRFYISTLDRASLRVPGQSHPVYFATKDEAAKFADKHLGEHLGPKMTPVNLESFIKRMDEVQKTDVTKMIGGKRAERLYGDMNKLLNEALTSGPNAEGKFVLVPERLIDRLNQHAKYEYGIGKVIRRVNREFKGSVLAFNPKWHIGNIIDMVTRLYFEGAGATSAISGERILREVKKVDEQAYNDILTVVGGGHLSHAADSLADLTNVDRALFESYSSAQRRALASALRLGPKGYRAAQRSSFQFAQIVEHHLRTVAIGKAAKQEARRLGHSWHKTILMQPKVIEQLAKGIVDDPNVITRYGTLVNKVMGDYTTMSPEFRASMLTYAPFLLWARASIKWVLALPASSPVRVSMITAVNRMNEEERRALGLSRFKQHAESLPEYMLGSIPSLSGEIPGDEPNKLFRTNAYTSFGPLTDFAGLGNFLLPQYKNILDAYAGLDWTGEEIVNKNGTPITDSQRIGIMLHQALETYVAPIAIGHGLLAEGDPSSTYTIFRLDKPPWEGVKDRKISVRPGRGGRYGKTEAVEADKYPLALSLTEGGLAKQFSPLYKTDNFIVTGRRQDKRQEKEEEMLVPEEDEHGWLFGGKDPKTGETPKRKAKLKKKVKESETQWLFGE